MAAGHHHARHALPGVTRRLVKGTQKPVGRDVVTDIRLNEQPYPLTPILFNLTK